MRKIKSNQRGMRRLGERIVGLIILLAIIGWCSNVYKLTQLDFEAPYRAEALRVVGLIPPIGAIMGYVDIDDSKKE